MTLPRQGGGILYIQWMSSRLGATACQGLTLSTVPASGHLCRLVNGWIKTEDVAMHVKEAIAERRSIRQYAEISIPQAHMEILFKALQSAPSASNLQNWEFIFVRDSHIKQHLVPACYLQKFVGECTYFIAGVADPSLKWHMVDITIALTNFTLQAVELGYGTCWIGAFNELMVKEVLGVPEEKKVVICMTFGVPRMTPPPRGRKATEAFINLDSYGSRWQSIS